MNVLRIVYIKNPTNFNLFRSEVGGSRDLVTGFEEEIIINMSNVHKHIEAEIKWPPFHRRHFQRHFLE